MTIDERVEWCLDQKGGRPLFGDEARAIIKQALTAAVEEERETCAKICEEEARPVSGSLGIAGVDQSGIVALKIAERIRAHGAEKEKE